MQIPETYIGISVVKNVQGILTSKKRNGSYVAQSDLEKEKEFNGQLTNMFNKNEHSQVSLLDRPVPFMEKICVFKGGETFHRIEFRT